MTSGQLARARELQNKRQFAHPGTQTKLFQTRQTGIPPAVTAPLVVNDEDAQRNARIDAARRQLENEQPHAMYSYINNNQAKPVSVPLPDSDFTPTTKPNCDAQQGESGIKLDKGDKIIAMLSGLTTAVAVLGRGMDGERAKLEQQEEKIAAVSSSAASLGNDAGHLRAAVQELKLEVGTINKTEAQYQYYARAKTELALFRSYTDPEEVGVILENERVCLLSPAFVDGETDGLVWSHVLRISTNGSVSKYAVIFYEHGIENFDNFEL